MNIWIKSIIPFERKPSIVRYGISALNYQFVNRLDLCPSYLLDKMVIRR